MRSLIVTEFISLDGVIDSPGGDEGHPHAGWTYKERDFVPEAYEIKGREQSEAGALLIGRKSWELFAPVWPAMTEFAEYNAMPKYVVSTTLTDEKVAEHPWGETSILRSIDEVAALKQTEGGSLLVHGSGALHQSLAAAGLVDRYHLLVFPTLLGSGRRLFADDATERRTDLRVVEQETYSNGVSKFVYDVMR